MSPIIKSVNSSFLYKLLTFGKTTSLSFDDTSIHIQQNNVKSFLKFDDIKIMAVESAFLWDNLGIVLKNNRTYRVDGFNKQLANKFHKVFTQHFANHYYTYFYAQAQKVLSLYPLDSEYFQEEKFKALVKIANKEMSEFHFLDEAENEKYTVVLTKAYNLCQGNVSVQRNHNDNFLRLEKQKYKTFFDTVEKNPLTDKQREAVIVNERANLIIAGAGSGKTSVMVARVGYILQKYNLSASEILVVAFGNAAAKELKERIEERLNIVDIAVSTFHSFGQNTIAIAEGKKPSLASWVEDSNRKFKLVEDILLELSDRDATFKKILLAFFAYPFSKYKSQFGFNTEIEYRQYMYENKVGSLRNDPVKSYEESQIANFLFLNGINYEYEPFYKYDTATVEHRQYQPDFYLPDYDIYLEHFGVDKNGKTAPFVPNKAYLEGMEWKRKLHKENETKLIETYSYYQQEGRLLHKLEDMLISNGVILSPVNITEALKTLPENTLISDFSKTLATFIGHYKANDHTIRNLRKRAGSSERLNAFLDLFEPVLNAYETTKRSIGVIDFDDMISQAIEYIESSRYKSKYKCILVDEYQDISTARARLIKALYEQVNDSILTVVGDDWQSIYRFAGSEISLFHDFEKYFGFSRKVKLDYTFRYNNKISSVSQKFIEANPNQIKKEIKTLTQVNTPAIHLWWGDDKDLTRVKQILSDIQSKKQGAAFSVFLLGRNRYSFPENFKSLWSQYPNINMSALTVHKSKGLEADITIIPGVFSGRLGFPSSIEGDPILDLALAKEEKFDYAEERRLFYVAITRAKEEVHILASNSNVSAFTKELEDEGYAVQHHYENNIKPEPCPKCKLGTLVVRRSNNRQFWGCSSYGSLECDYTAKISYCSKKTCNGVMQYGKKRHIYKCTNDNCQNEEKACPSCGGKLEIKFNRKQNNRPFYGCSNYSKLGCGYTEDVE